MQLVENKINNPIVLVVDDVPKNLQLVGNILLEQNIKPNFSTNGIHALKFLEENNPDLILLDISMPEMDGFEVCEKIKSNPKTSSIPIIFLTARTQTEEIIKGFELGAVDYITKPFNKGELLSRINTHLRLKRAIETINKQNDELIKLNNTKDRIFSIIGHDLRGPVGNFKYLLNFLFKNEKTSEIYEEMFHVLNDSITNTYSLLDNLLNWAKSQQNEIKIKKQKLCLNEELNNIVSFYTPEALKKKITLNLISDHECYIVADPEMLAVVIRNLINNAIKFTNFEGLIELSYTSDSEFATVCVKDNGVGMTDDIMKKIFDPTEIVVTFGTDSEKGSGLGIKLCKEFVEKNDGKIWVESEINTGSKFFFTIPLFKS